MTVEYSIDEKDYLTFQLFTASQSELISKRRFRAKTIPPVIYVVLGCVMIVYQRLDFTIIFGLLAVVWYLFYPLREKRLYKDNYEKFIRQNLKDKFGQKATLTIGAQHLVNKDEIGENRIKLTEIAMINEIPELILIKLKQGQTFILPKNKISDADALRIKLKDLADELGIVYRNEYEWRWK